jgi:hypothetical protein
MVCCKFSRWKQQLAYHVLLFGKHGHDPDLQLFPYHLPEGCRTSENISTPRQRPRGMKHLHIAVKISTMDGLKGSFYLSFLVILHEC